MNEVKINELIKMVQDFCEERDWDQYHNPKELAIGMSTEANELLEIFRFKNETQMKDMFKNEKTIEHIKEEYADVFFFMLRFAQMNNLDIEACLKDKIDKNNKKYPVELSKGKNAKYNEFK